MEFCAKCGAALQDDLLFCTKCGARRNVVYQTRTEKRAASSKRAARKTERKPIPRSAKIGLAALIILAAGLAVLHFQLSARYDPVRVVGKFEEVVNERNSEEMAAMLNRGQPLFQASENDAAEFIKFLREENNFGEIIRGLRKEAYLMGGSGKSDAVFDANGNRIAALQRGGSRWLFYHEYKLVFFPIEVRVESNLKNAKIWWNGKKVGKIQKEGQQEGIGFVFPGVHYLSCTFDGEFVTLENGEKLDFTKVVDNMLTVDVKFETAEVALYSNFDDAILFVNGKSTGRKVVELGTIGPLPVDGTTNLHAERTVNGKREKTETYKVIDSSNVDFLFDVPEPEAAAASSSSSSAVVPGTGTGSSPKIVSPGSNSAGDGNIPEYGEDEIARFMDSYFSWMVACINTRDSSFFGEIYDSEGRAYSEFKSYLAKSIVSETSRRSISACSCWIMRKRTVAFSFIQRKRTTSSLATKGAQLGKLSTPNFTSPLNPMVSRSTLSSKPILLRVRNYNLRAMVWPPRLVMGWLFCINAQRQGCCCCLVTKSSFSARRPGWR